MSGRSLRLRWVLVVAALACTVASCSNEPPPAIDVRGADLVVQNQTSVAWSGVEIWVNDFYRGLAPSIEAGQQLVVPLGNLIESYGRRFDVHRQPVVGVLVKARAADGRAVRLTWGRVRRD